GMATGPSQYPWVSNSMVQAGRHGYLSKVLVFSLQLIMIRITCKMQAFQKSFTFPMPQIRLLPLCLALSAVFPARAQETDDQVLQAVKVTAARADGFAPKT